MKIAKLPIITGVIVGVLAPLLVYLGNPGNMGFCGACFLRDIAGALGLHRAGVVQYIRPEILGLVLGALGASMFFKEFRSRGGSAPLVRFFLGAFAMIGALVFLGCPWRAWLRLGGGDLSAIAGILGLIVGILVGIYFLKRGFTLGRARTMPKFSAFIAPMLVLGLLFFLLSGVKFGENAPIFFSQKGPGSMHASIIISLLAGLVIGIFAQRSRFCTIAAVRDTVLVRDTHILQGVLALFVAALITNIILGQFHLGFINQPIAHNQTVWNFLGMLLSGLAFTLAGGCPGRQLILSGEGDNDAGVFIIGMVAGAAFAHNFALAASPAGITPFAPYALVLGILFCLVLGFSAREKI